MSDTGRRSFNKKAAAALKPDGHNSTEQWSDHFRGTGDSVASTFHPQSDKGFAFAQKAVYYLSSDLDENDESLFTKAKNAVGMGERK
ncbi:hypothetical protein C8R46DRAFT_1216143 [Mycena filopes]|nr:hypothetical protein C8R46DRAFT_1216143 [Mycena filopes]